MTVKFYFSPVGKIPIFFKSQEVKKKKAKKGRIFLFPTLQRINFYHTALELKSATHLMTKVDDFNFLVINLRVL